MTPAIEFLEFPTQKWTGIIKATVRASVEELAHMNRICFSASSQNSIFDSDDPKLSHENLPEWAVRARSLEIATSGPTDQMEANQ